MKQALIDKKQPRYSGYRVAQVVNTGETFPVDESFLAWVACPDNIIADEFWYSETNNTFYVLPDDIDDIHADATDPTLALCFVGGKHFLNNGDSVNMLNQEPAEYAGTFTITVVDDITFSYKMNIAPATPATVLGTYTINY
jgi:hypothetical protein